jgi:hypothetical protein
MPDCPPDDELEPPDDEEPPDDDPDDEDDDPLDDPVDDEEPPELDPVPASERPLSNPVSQAWNTLRHDVDAHDTSPCRHCWHALDVCCSQLTPAAVVHPLCVAHVSNDAHAPVIIPLA